MDAYQVLRYYVSGELSDPLIIKKIYVEKKYFFCFIISVRPIFFNRTFFREMYSPDFLSVTPVKIFVRKILWVGGGGMIYSWNINKFLPGVTVEGTWCSIKKNSMLRCFRFLEIVGIRAWNDLLQLWYAIVVEQFLL